MEEAKLLIKQSAIKVEKQKGTKIPKIVMAVVFILGCLMFCYPFFSNWYVRNVQTHVSNNYRQMVHQKVNQEKLDSIKKTMKSYNKKLQSGVSNVIKDPFADDSTEEGDLDYAYNVVSRNLGEIVAVVKIPIIDVNLPIYNNTTDLQLQEGAGLLRGTSMLTGGKGSHSVVTGHRGLPSAKLFTDLPKLKTGDQFYIEILDEVHAYQVDKIAVIEPSDTNELQAVADKDYVTLMTCTPYMINTHRLLVRGHRIPYNPATTSEQNLNYMLHTINRYAGIIIVGLNLTILIYLYKLKRRNDHLDYKKLKRVTV